MKRKFEISMAQALPGRVKCFKRGTYHRILLKDDARPCRERVRGGSRAGGLIKEEEDKILLKNNIPHVPNLTLYPHQ